MKYKIGDIAKEISVRINDPANSGYDKFVGLEHYESGEVRIHNYGSTELLGSAMKEFKAGDILLARRNVYLRRASVVDFDGITSGDSIVLRVENPVIARIVPFILNTDDFWNFADMYSDGTMSKRLSPKILKEYEFELPEGDKLKWLADTLWAAYETKEKYVSLLQKTDELVKSQFIEMFGDPEENPLGWDTRPLLTMGSCKNGMNFHSNDSGVEINCLGVGDFKDYDVIEDTHMLPAVSLNEMPSEDYLLKDGDIVFVRSNGNKTMVGRSVIVYPGDNPTTFSGFCIRYRNEDESIMVPYLLRVLKSESVRKQMYGRGANIQNLNQKTLAALNIPIPPMEAQRQYVEIVEQSDKSKFEIQHAINDLNATIRALVQQTE
ncbi:restriction endonuclease subunit S [Pseudobutyrivibrio xylanivorans]|uniref:Type I restriction enzyme, S subunit n=1 Tax=Pseudobutyrivibrio xylanivorans DSM 14809 TaxID=1123012 RepID=A0A1M6HL30_PSEXY|nr:restriction endonuclease subunit S [Pseudobutyrivibrio xylanivorans]SHJ22875.1 type I restriction enzyme, S subunit [Pseudobutyrivibrio xylanivorans DSM 14809]